MNSNEDVAEKCTLCIQLTDRGEMAQCVANCPGRARMIGDLDDPTDPVAIIAKNAPTGSFRKLKDVGNKPVGGYILRKLKWIEPL
jgi:molybdopterin-containing oxidoreductase family iron-sulfur binding subunit